MRARLVDDRERSERRALVDASVPLLPGNAGVYQGAALGALAIVHKAGTHAVAASLLAPVVVSVACGVAALVGLALYGRRFAELSRVAFSRRALQFGA